MPDYFSIDPDAKRDLTWPWGEFLADRATTITAATVVADTPANVTFLTLVDIDGSNVSVRVQISAAVDLTCHIVCANGEEEDWTMSFDVKHH